MAHRTAFASDFGWKPGQWPETLVKDGETFKRAYPITNNEMELQYYVYRSTVDYGGTFNVYND